MPSQTEGFSWLVTLLVALIPAVAGFAGALVTRGSLLPRPYRKLDHVVRILAKTPDGSQSRAALDSLVASMIEPLATAAASTGKPTLNPYKLIGTIILVIITIGAMWGLVQWSVTTTEASASALAWTVTGLVGVTLGVLVGLAVATLYKPVIARAGR
ncbi:hypothetical protein BH10ACT7_BH10ACT7_04150 [soil metagenome]